MNKFSIIIPAYNCAGYIDETIRSVLSQFSENDELIVVDDGSTDETVSRILHYRDYPAVNIILSEHKGASGARNTGIDAAKGDYITFLDCDDRLMENFLKTAHEMIKKADLYIFGIRREKLSGETENWEVSDHFYPAISDFADTYIRSHNLLIYSNCNKFYKRSIIDKLSLRFNEEYTFGEDRLFNYNYLFGCNSVQTSSVLMLRYIERSGGSMSSRHIRDYFITALRLHKAKTKCFLALSKGTTYAERSDFITYDLANEIEKMIVRFEQHKEEIPENLPLINRMAYGNLPYPEGEFDYVIIFGSGNCGYRAEIAFEKYGGFPDTRFIVSGGNIHKSGSTEAAFMKDLLLEKGIGSGNIYVEDESANTKENLVNSAKLISAINDRRSGKLRICIVTAGFHIMRTNILLKKIPFYQTNEVFFLPAYGPNTAPDKWFELPVGRKIILDEIKKVMWAGQEESL